MDKVEVFVDGACKNNGHNNPQAGCGVYWGPFHPLNWSEKLRGDKQTNNRAEISAAIIGISQAIELNFREIIITTDSKYLKDGITKWMKEWKINNWKTSKKGDVLNKDLWLILDKLQGKLIVSWRWVEGHKDSIGNLNADDLAKAGISEKNHCWQTAASIHVNKDPITQHVESDKAVVDPIEGKDSTNHESTDPQIKQEYVCKTCQLLCKEDDLAIQCQECKFWSHYSCTNLPHYQLYLFENTQRRYTCQYCVELDEKFISKIQEVKPQNSLSSLKLDKFTETDEDINIKKNSFSSVSTQSDSTNIQFIDLDEFRNTTISLLQDSFVGAFDKINSSVKDMKIDLIEDETLRQRILNLTRENERLKADNQSREKKEKCTPCSSCENMKVKIEKLSKDIDKEREQSHLKLHSLTLDKELQEAKLRSDLKLLNHRVQGMDKQEYIQKAEIESLQKRLEIKNESIINLEEKVAASVKKIEELQEEVISWKISNIRKEPFSELPKDKRRPESTPKSDIPDELCGKETVEQDTSKIGENTQKSNSHVDKSAEANNYARSEETETATPKKQISLVGTSNTRFISSEYVGGSEFQVSKTMKFTLSETQDYVSNLKVDEKQDVFILQSLCNDIRNKTPDECAEKIQNIVKTLTSKFDSCKVVVSLGLPNKDTGINKKTEKTNILIKEKLSGIDNVHICDNSNLFYRGDAQRGVLNTDGIHLARPGVNKLARNLKEKLIDIFGTAKDPNINKREKGNRRRNEGDRRLNEGDRRRNEGDRKWNEGDRRLNEGNRRWNEGNRQRNESYRQWNEGDRRLNESKRRWNEGDRRLNEGDRRWNEGNRQWNDGDRRLNEGNRRWNEGDRRLNEGNRRWNEGDRQWNEGDRRLNEGDRRWNEGDRRWNEGDRRWNEGNRRWNEGDRQWNEGDRRRNEGDRQWNEGDRRWNEGDRRWNEGDRQWNEGDRRWKRGNKRWNKGNCTVNRTQSYQGRPRF